jgi:Cation transporting ATPase, C-terminus
MQLAFTYLPPFQGLFATVALDPTDWGLVAALAVGLFLAVEAEKEIVRQFG